MSWRIDIEVSPALPQGRRFRWVVVGPADRERWRANLAALLHDLVIANPGRCVGVSIGVHPAACDSHE